MHLRIGSRGSQLALWQARHIAATLRSLGHTAEIVIIRTTGDRLQDPAFAAAHPVTPELDGKGIFIKEIEQALAEKSIDLAVHSLKDLPTKLDAQFTLAAIPERADPSDALLCMEWSQLHTLPDNSRVGTSSPRRVAQLLSHRPDLQFVSIRGNIDTRIRKLREGQCDALVLASAGLDRLGTRVLAAVELDPAHPEHGREPHMECVTHAGHEHHEEDEVLADPSGHADWIRQRFTPDILCPAPGQGALAVETRADDTQAIAAIRPIDHAETRYAVEAERALLHALGGGCSLPVGALCTGGVRGAMLYSTVTAPDGEQLVTVELLAEAGESAESLGVRAANDLVARGARELLDVEVAI